MTRSCRRADHAPGAGEVFDSFLLDDPGLAAHQFGADVALKAKDYLGVPYKFGGTHLNKGLDCSYLVQHLFGRARGVQLPRTARLQHAATRPVARDELREGDLIFFKAKRRHIDHVGIYVGEGRFIHASRHERKVTTARLDDPYWRRRVAALTRVDLPVLVGQNSHR